MTPIDRFERHLPAALADLGEVRSPDYLADILGRTVRTRQRPRWASLERWLPMPIRRSPRVVLAVAVGALVTALAGLSLLTAGAPVAGPPSTVPAELLGRWMGGPRSVPGLAEGSGSSLFFGPATLSLSRPESNAFVLVGVNAAMTAGGLVLTDPGGTPPCGGGEPGRYAWSLTGAGLTLTLTATADPCAERIEAFAGTWQRMGCIDPMNNCLGAMEAGAQDTQFFDPQLAPDEAWAPRYGQLTFTVPEGWAMTADWPAYLYLETAAWYAANGGRSDIDTDGIYVLARPGAVVRSTTCSAELDPTVGTRAADLAAFLTDHPDLLADPAQPITIGSMAGFSVDVRLDPSVVSSCDGATGINLFVERGDGVWIWGTTDDEAHRYLILDIDADSTVLIDIGTDQGDFDALLEAAMPIVQSFVIAE